MQTWCKFPSVNLQEAKPNRRNVMPCDDNMGVHMWYVRTSVCCRGQHRDAHRSRQQQNLHKAHDPNSHQHSRHLRSLWCQSSSSPRCSEDLQPAATLDSRVVLNFQNVTEQEDKVSWLLVSWGKTDGAESHSDRHENKNAEASDEWRSVSGTTACVFSFL